MYWMVLQTAEDEADYQRLKAELADPIKGNPISEHLNDITSPQSAQDEMTLFRAAAGSGR
jgi:hypothetical protein